MAAAPAAPLVMDWLVPAGATAGATASSRGLAHRVTFNSRTPPLQVWCPSLPYTADAAVDLVLEYMPAAFSLWPAFVLSDPAVHTRSFDAVLLQPSAMARVQTRLTDQGFPLQVFTTAQLALSLQAWVAEHPHDDYVLKPADLGATQPISRTHAPLSKLDFVPKLRWGL